MLRCRKMCFQVVTELERSPIAVVPVVVEVCVALDVQVVAVAVLGVWSEVA